MRKQSQKLVDWLLVAVIFSVFFLTLIPIILRNLGYQSIPGLEVIVRYLVVWLTFLGAAAAAREKRHIAIDVLPKLLPFKSKQFLRNFAAIVSAVISLLLAWASIRFLAMEMQLEYDFVVGTARWWDHLKGLGPFIVIPIGFFLIAIEHIISLKKEAKW